jgi:hypothetical protein
MGTIEVNKLVEALLRELEAVASNDERDAHDPTWLRGYVAGVAAAASTAMSLRADLPAEGKAED